MYRKFNNRRAVVPDRNAPVWHPAFQEWITDEITSFFGGTIPKNVHIFSSFQSGTVITRDDINDEFRCMEAAFASGSRDMLLNMLKTFLKMSVSENGAS